MPTSPNDPLNQFARSLERGVNHVVPRFKSFWERVTEGIELQQLWAQFVAEARVSYALYSREVDWKSIEAERRSHRTWNIIRAFFWAMILKLSPARRVFLLMALVLSALALLDVRIEFGETTRIQWNGQPFFILAAAALLLLLALELADRVTMKRDLEIAREIQRRLVPAEPPTVPGYDIAFATRPANTVAGDYYDAFIRDKISGSADPGGLLLVVADVAGKGVPAALVMATFQASLRTLALEPASLIDLVAGLNAYACHHGVGGQRFITAFLAEINLTTRALTFINAGHNPPILRRPSGALERLEAGGLPFGIKPEAHYESGSATIAPGDLLVIFTDGVVEAENERGEEYGDPRLVELLNAEPQGSAADQLKNLMNSVDGFVRATRQHDDITCLFLKVT
jgi:sigma-B regulation protein RsbU (phosphoserine phosphatase)